MTLSEIEIEQLEAFWEGALSPSQKALLERRLQDDVLFRQAAHELQLTTTGLHVLSDQKASLFLRQLEQSLPPLVPPQSRPFINWQWWTQRRRFAAAAIILLLLLGWWFLRKKEAPKSIAEQNFEPYPPLGYTLSSKEQTLKAEAFNAYYDKDFKAARSKFEALFRENGDSLALFYAGVSAVGARQYTQAIAVLESMQFSEKAPADAAQWYLALALLETDRNDRAESLLLALSRSDSPYSARATDVLAQMNVK